MRYAYATTLMLVLACAGAGAQTPPTIRQLGRIERVSTDSLASIAAALPMSDGRVLINDITGRRVLLVDSTLAHARVVADTTSATANAYGTTPGTLIRYRGDSALFIDASSLSMLVLGPAGTIARIMAIPRPNDIGGLIGGLYGTPGVDAKGRLVYYSGTPAGFISILRRGARVSLDPDKQSATPEESDERIDSAFVVRVDPATRVVDTMASFKITRFHRVTRTDGHGLILAFETIPDPLPLVDDWVLLPDGSLAVVRGRDYHVDWISPDGPRSSAKMPFEWQRVSDERKQMLIDSATTAVQARLDEIVGMAFARGAGGSRGRGGSGATGPTIVPPDAVPNLAKPPALGDLPDYVPPFVSGAARSDVDGNLWIRTSTMVQGQPVYHIVNRRGEVVDHVQLPSFRTIAGFGPGVVYMAMKDAAGAVHLERVRVK